jgi:5-methylcytosine-specific restriction endonuclease McrA
MARGREQLRAQWIQVELTLVREYARHGIDFRMATEIPEELPDLAEPGTFTVPGRVRKGDYEDAIEVPCTSTGGGRFSFPITEPTSLRPEVVRSREIRREIDERLAERERRLEEHAASPEAQRRRREDERIAAAERLVAERRRREKLAWAERVLEGSASQREPIPTEVRRTVFERDGGRCVECGSSFDLQYDHIIPLALGGSNGVDNLQVLCGSCNRRKGATL